MCSDCDFQSIIEKQTSAPLSFSEAIDSYTKCRDGCGGCIELLREVFEDRGIYIDASETETILSPNSRH